MSIENHPTNRAIIRACGCPEDRDYDCYMCDLGGWAGTPHDCPGKRLCNHTEVRRLLAAGDLIVDRDGVIVRPPAGR